MSPLSLEPNKATNNPPPEVAGRGESCKDVYSRNVIVCVTCEMVINVTPGFSTRLWAQVIYMVIVTP